MNDQLIQKIDSSLREYFMPTNIPDAAKEIAEVVTLHFNTEQPDEATRLVSLEDCAKALHHWASWGGKIDWVKDDQEFFRIAARKVLDAGGVKYE